MIHTIQYIISSSKIDKNCQNWSKIHQKFVENDFQRCTLTGVHSIVFLMFLLLRCALNQGGHCFFKMKSLNYSTYSRMVLMEDLVCKQPYQNIKNIPWHIRSNQRDVSQESLCISQDMKRIDRIWWIMKRLRQDSTRFDEIQWDLINRSDQK